MTELQAFLAMLERAFVGHGTRADFDPPGTGVQVEGEWEGDPITEFWFDADGRLVTVAVITDD